jgi:hypothetical protein
MLWLCWRLFSHPWLILRGEEKVKRVTDGFHDRVFFLELRSFHHKSRSLLVVRSRCLAYTTPILPLGTASIVCLGSLSCLIQPPRGGLAPEWTTSMPDSQHGRDLGTRLLHNGVIVLSPSFIPPISTFPSLSRARRPHPSSWQA